jgi:hypothetical protein
MLSKAAGMAAPGSGQAMMEPMPAPAQGGEVSARADPP